jgi:flagellar FliJ protein
MDARMLGLLIDRALRRRDADAGEAAGARRARDAAAGTLRTLTDYREESLGRAPVRSGQPVGVDQLRAAQHFDAKLIAAIGQQHQQHARTQARVQARDGALADSQRRLKALETLARRRARAAALVEARREQHALDEHATNLAARRPHKDRP